jgi:hypothetical protein
VARVRFSPVPPAFRGHEQDRRRRAVDLERLDHPVAADPRHAAVKERRLREAEAVGQVAGEQLAHPPVLGEHQRSLPRGEHLGEHLARALELAGAARQRPGLAEQLGRVVAHLLQGGQQREDLAAPVDPLRAGESSAEAVSTVAW